MAGRKVLPGKPDRSVLAGVRAVVFAVVVLGPDLAVADNSRPVQLAAITAQAPARTTEPDVFARIARWFEKTFAGLGKVGDQTRGAFKDVADGVSESAEAVAALPNVRIVSKRQRCEPAANGAPDCRRAAETACRSRGFASGRSLETQSERVCTAPRLFAQQASGPSGCRTETHVLRAICQ